MKLLEYQGKRLLKKYGIPTSRGVLCPPFTNLRRISGPCVLKSQVPSGDRKRKGGIVFAAHSRAAPNAARILLAQEIDGVKPEKILVEEQIKAKRELYVSFSYSTDTRTPVFSVAKDGGSGIRRARVIPLDAGLGLPDFFLRAALAKTDVAFTRPLASAIQSLWKLFVQEKALLAEINPLFETESGYIAGDAKIILDDNVVRPHARPFLNLRGDIAVMASGGGASLLNLDSLIRYGGKPANYCEYSGNPPAEIVRELTKKTLARPGLKGCWVVGGTANFTDIYETMSGFVAGLKDITPKPRYPIVIRRDGPRQKEAFRMLKKTGEREQFDFHLFGSETAMSESARVMVELAYGTTAPHASP